MFSDPPLTGRPTQAAIDALASVVGLLHEASIRTTEWLLDANRTGGFATVHSGELLAATYQAAELLGEGFDYSGYPEPIETDPVLLLRAADQLLRAEPLPSYPPGTQLLVVRVIGLLGDAEQLSAG